MNLFIFGQSLLHDCLFTFKQSTLGQSALIQSVNNQATYDQTWVASIHTKYPLVLEVVVIGDQLTYLEVAFLQF